MVKGKNTKYLYLAGPIEGCELKEIIDWRQDTVQYFEDSSEQIVTVNPFRAEERFHWDRYERVRHLGRAIYDKNWFDCTQSDSILAYLPKEINDRRPSIGTLFEIAWFVSMRKPIFIVSDDDVYTSHPLIKTNTGWIYDNFEECHLAILSLLEY